MINHNNNITNIDEFIENDFMTSEIYDKELREELTVFLEKIGGMEDE